MYDADLHSVSHSKIIKAMTQYKLASLQDNITPEKVMKLCNTIGDAKGAELNGIIDLTRLAGNLSATYLYEDILIWRACTLLKENKPIEAISTLKPLIVSGASNFNFKFIDFILKQCTATRTKKHILRHIKHKTKYRVDTRAKNIRLIKQNKAHVYLKKTKLC